MNPFELPDLSNVDTGKVIDSNPPRPLLLHKADSDFVLQIDNSTMEVFQTCPRAAFYHCIKRRQKSGRPALIFGGAIHAALEHFYLTGLQDLTGGLKKALEYMKEQDYRPGEDWRTEEMAIMVLTQYFNYYTMMQEITPIVVDGELMVERSFELPIGTFDIKQQLPFTYADLHLLDTFPDADPNEKVYIDTLHIHWTGKIDLITYDLADQDLCICDHKTTSMGGDTFFRDFEITQQTVGYAWAASKLIDKPINNFLLNALMIRKPTRTGKGTTFERRKYYYPQSHIDEWEKDIYACCESFVFSMLHNSFPKHTKWCMGKYGACQYHKVCTSLPSARDFVLSTDMFSNVTWSPLNE